jgi:hypothetical protein
VIADAFISLRSGSTSAQLATAAVGDAAALHVDVVASSGAAATRVASFRAAGVTMTAPITAPDFTCAGCIATSEMADGAVTASKLAPNAVVSTSIADGSVSSADIADGSVSSADIADGSLTNADVSSSAAIAGSKIVPSFGAQDITSTTTLSTGGMYWTVYTGWTAGHVEWLIHLEGAHQETFLDMRLNAGHCGGGCHYAFRDVKMYFNAYQDMFIQSDRVSDTGDYGTWDMGRPATGHNGHGPTSTQLILKKTAGSVSFEGPVTITIVSNNPLTVVSRTN